MKTSRFIRRLWMDIQHGENLDLLITVILSIVILVLNAIGVAIQPTLLTSVTLAALGLISISLLISRYKLDDIARNQSSVKGVEFLTKIPQSIGDRFASEKEIWMLGLILRGTITGYYHELTRKVERGGKLRTLIVNANKVNMEEVVKRFSRGGTEDQFRADFQQTINQHKQLCQSAKNHDNVQMKLIGFVPPFSLYIFPKSEDGGVIFVETYGFKSPMGSVPKFMITEHEHPDWYNHFISQFEAMWKDSESVIL